METIRIAFDVDGTLRNNNYTDRVIANERIRTLLITLSSMKNVYIIVWSGGGELYARQMAKALNIEKYIDEYAGKVLTPVAPNGVLEESPIGKVDISFDDIHSCRLADKNLIVREE